jgi:hypothetical protein
LLLADNVTSFGLASTIISIIVNFRITYHLNVKT